MKHMNRLTCIFVALLAFTGAAFGQSCTGQFQSGQVCGNATGGQRSPTGSSVTSILDTAFGSTANTLLGRGASAWGLVTPGGGLSLSGGNLIVANTITAAGPIGDATHVAQITFNSRGQLTAVSSVLISGVAPAGPAGGDLSGTYPNPTVAKINGNTLGSTTPTAGNLLIGSGTQWVTNAVTGVISITSGGVTALTSSAFANPSASVGLSAVNGSATTSMRSDAAPALSSAVQTALTGTNHGVLLGTGAFGFNAAAVGATKSVLQGSAGADPAFTTTPTVAGLTANNNAASLQAAQTGTVLRGASPDGTASRVELDVYAAQAFFTAVCANGTAGTPTTLTAATQCGGFNMFGYDGTAFGGPAATFRTFANQNWAVGAHGSYAEVAVTPNGSTTLTVAMRWENDGGITVPNTVTGGSKGAGSVNMTSCFVANVACATTATANVITVSNSDGTLTISPTSGSVVASLALAHANTWAALQQFTDQDFALLGGSSGSLKLRCALACGSQTIVFPAGTTDFSSTGGTSQVLKQVSVGAAITVAQLTFADIATGTAPAFTLGGTISGGGNQINNVVIGASTPLAGSFTTVAASTSVATPLDIGGSGTTGVQKTFQTTTGNGTTDQFAFKGGNNGGTTFATLDATAATFFESVSTAGSIVATSSVIAGNATSITSGGTAGIGLKVSSTSNFGIFFGSGVPTISAAQGSLYLRSDGTSNNRLYINTNGSTVWTAFNTTS